MNNFFVYKPVPHFSQDDIEKRKIVCFENGSQRHSSGISTFPEIERFFYIYIFILLQGVCVHFLLKSRLH